MEEKHLEAGIRKVLLRHKKGLRKQHLLLGKKRYMGGGGKGHLQKKKKFTSSEEETPGTGK